MAWETNKLFQFHQFAVEWVIGMQWNTQHTLLQQPDHPFLLFAALKQTTVPIGQDDINEKAQDAWEELNNASAHF